MLNHIGPPQLRKFRVPVQELILRLGVTQGRINEIVSLATPLSVEFSLSPKETTRRVSSISPISPFGSRYSPYLGVLGISYTLGAIVSCWLRCSLVGYSSIAASLTPCQEPTLITDHCSPSQAPLSIWDEIRHSCSHRVRPSELRKPHGVPKLKIPGDTNANFWDQTLPTSQFPL